MVSNALHDGSADTWTFFRRSEEPELWCAVPATGSLPGFLLSGHWRFTGQRPGHVAPQGFRLNAARESEHLNGFYLFQVVEAMDDAR